MEGDNAAAGVAIVMASNADYGAVDWQRIAEDLASALLSFTGYTGLTCGGVPVGNQGDWNAAYRSAAAYRRAKDLPPNDGLEAS